MALDAHQEQTRVRWVGLVNADRDRIVRHTAAKEMKMSVNDPTSPFGDQPPMPAQPGRRRFPLKNRSRICFLTNGPIPIRTRPGTRDPPVTEPGVGM